jgi:hypothetical protein
MFSKKQAETLNLFFFKTAATHFKTIYACKEVLIGLTGFQKRPLTTMPEFQVLNMQFLCIKLCLKWPFP